MGATQQHGLNLTKTKQTHNHTVIPRVCSSLPVQRGSDPVPQLLPLLPVGPAAAVVVLVGLPLPLLPLLPLQSQGQRVLPLDAARQPTCTMRVVKGTFQTEVTTVQEG